MSEDCIYPISSARGTGKDIGIVISKSGNQLHCGLTYGIQNDMKCLHLAFHLHLSDSNNFTYFIKPSNEIPLSRQLSMSAKCELIHNTKDRYPIPYAFLYEGAEFNKEGILELGGNEHGLTCATFVLAFFKSCGYELINIDHWPRRDEDSVWHRSILDYLKDHATDEHVRNVENEIGCARFRPEEVAMSSTFKDFPGNFVDIIRRGSFLKELM